LAEVRLPHLSETHFRQWADRRLKEIQSSSVRREWNVLSNVLTCASKEWGLIPENFMLRLNKPANSPARTQRISDEVAEQIAYVANYCPNCTPHTSTQRVACGQAKFVH
jgi:phage integrase family protein